MPEDAPMPSQMTARQALQKPPGYRDPAAALPSAPRPPPQRRPQLPPMIRPPVKYRSPGRRHCCRRICCWISVILLALLFLLAVASALAFLWFQPRLPAFRLVSVQARPLRIVAGPDGDLFDATATVRIQAKNLNGKITLDYGGSEARVAVVDEDGDLEVGYGEAPGLVQARRNATVLRFTASVKGMLVDDAVGGRLSARIKSKEIRFSVEVRTRVGIPIPGKRTGTLPILVVCPAGSLKQLGNGGFSPKCRIYLLGWINLRSRDGCRTGGRIHGKGCIWLCVSVEKFRICFAN